MLLIFKGFLWSDISSSPLVYSFVNSSPMSTWSFQPHKPGSVPDWHVTGVPSLFIRLCYQCSAGVTGNLTVNITEKWFPCILSIFCSTSTSSLFFVCSCYLVGRDTYPWSSDNFLYGYSYWFRSISFHLLSEVGVDSHSNIRKENLVISLSISIYTPFFLQWCF